MNPLFVQLHAAAQSDAIREARLPLAEDPGRQIAIAYDREYIAAHARHFDYSPDLVAYDRAPLAGEWAEPLLEGCFVRVFVINDCTTVRVLHNGMSERIGSPIIDSWRVALAP